MARSGSIVSFFRLYPFLGSLDWFAYDAHAVYWILFGPTLDFGCNSGDEISVGEFRRFLSRASSPGFCGLRRGCLLECMSIRDFASPEEPRGVVWAVPSPRSRICARVS